MKLVVTFSRRRWIMASATSDVARPVPGAGG